MKLKKADKVVMLAGRDKGKTGEVARVFPATGQVIVEGLNVVKRHTKPSNKIPKGGILEIAKPIQAGKVALICPSCKKPTRIGYDVTGKNKERICRKCKAMVK
jgi:large subunit ribosomal protein L24